MQGNGETDSSTSLGMTMAGRLPALQRWRTAECRPYTRECVANTVRRYKNQIKNQKIKTKRRI